ncbi:MAG: 3-hydroxybutyryl-CoA dehydrogenase [Actinomycetota bacterium]
MEASDVNRVGVVGAGTMGAGIVEVAARAGIEVVYLEATDELVDAARARIDASLGKAVERGKLSDDEREAIAERVSGVTDVAELAGVDLVIEAATEDRDAKLGIFRRLDAVLDQEVVLASNTSSIPIGELAGATGRPDRVIGMHFFNPPQVMRLLELIAADTTSEETFGLARGVGERLGKTCVRSVDRAGFIVNRLLIPYLNDAARVFEEGRATREDIDTAIELGLGHPMGPLRLADLIGIDVVVAICEVLERSLDDERYAPAPVLRRMVDEGRLGRKSGGGFYDIP